MATLTFVYAESTAVIGPLATSVEPHSWDLCEDHARRITVPRGWEMLRSERGFSAPIAEDYELTALAEAVREVGGGSRAVGMAHSRADRRDADALDGFDDGSRGRHRAPGQPSAGAPGVSGTGGGPTDRSRSADRPRSGRRGHLRVLPDPVD